jgi:hypothetical protein
MKAIGVDCTFAVDGTVQVRRIAVDGAWEAVEQGRQWLDEAGRHVLVMRGGVAVREIVLQRDGLAWGLKKQQGPQVV